MNSVDPHYPRDDTAWFVTGTAEGDPAMLARLLHITATVRQRYPRALIFDHDCEDHRLVVARARHEVRYKVVHPKQKLSARPDAVVALPSKANRALTDRARELNLTLTEWQEGAG